ncbi:hypothetical protein BDQ12DRAFT_673206 [Crucibulum laeve]|uniref:Uncharacterized protein n=1 Tax=Crucibulum laeve TaxID=68775 RepID=A0A5C3MJH9_9AGAR|nr:hypothetical protein BDQ12DRAFT_673206 [Crucibulum laeve]
MSTVRTRTFCCCIPVRAGAILISLLGFLGGGTITAVGIISLIKPSNGGNKTSLIIQVCVYALLAILSLFGLIGAIAKKLGMVRIYFGSLMFHLFFSIGCGIYAIYNTFKDSPNYVRECVSGSLDPSVFKTCKDGSTLMKALMIGVFVIAWLLEIWACVIVQGYSQQLNEEARNKNLVKDTEAW